MSVIFSRECEYAIQALIFLAKQERNTWISIKDVAQQINIPQHFLGKIFQKLVQKGIVISQKGFSGGFKLTKDVNKISIFEVVEAIDGDGYRTKCVMGFPDCSADSPCPIHNKWKSIRDDFVKLIKSKKLFELAHEIKKPGY
ncbi:MAG: Rrf2 family transcriptional regulator [Ignavibacteriae bacterium]|nr:MAG: Rrf2 family transcriptional regulator [Ignavibacteriota bacterium]